MQPGKGHHFLPALGGGHGGEEDLPQLPQPPAVQVEQQVVEEVLRAHGQLVDVDPGGDLYPLGSIQAAGFVGVEEGGADLVLNGVPGSWREGSKGQSAMRVRVTLGRKARVYLTIGHQLGHRCMELVHYSYETASIAMVTTKRAAIAW